MSRSSSGRSRGSSEPASFSRIAPAEVVHEPQLRAAVARRLDRLVVPLQQPLGVGERCRPSRRGRRPAGRRPRSRSPRSAARRSRSPARPARTPRVSISTRSRTTSQSSFASASRCSRALAEPTAGFSPITKKPLTSPSSMPSDRRVGRVVAVDARQVVEAEVVLGRRRVAPPRLQQADHVRASVPPVAGRRGCSARRSPPASACGVRVRHREVAGQDVVERRDVGRALDRGVPAQRQDPAAGAADVAEQQLQDRGGADVLHADRVLRPADRVARTPSCARGRSSRTAPRPPRGTLARARRRPRSTISGV